MNEEQMRKLLTDKLRIASLQVKFYRGSPNEGFLEYWKGYKTAIMDLMCEDIKASVENNNEEAA